MKNLFLVLMVLSVSFLAACKKDGNGGKINTIQISEGEFNGYEHTFTPNLGFWSPVDETTRYVHLVLGDDDNLANAAENVMSIVFYYNGSDFVQFPTAQGQWVQFGINFDGTVYYFREESAILNISFIDAINFEGNLTGQFMDMNDNSRKLSFSMRISIPLMQI